MFRPALFAALLIALCSAFGAPSAGQADLIRSGSDLFVSGVRSVEPLAAEGDIFVTGWRVVIRGEAPADVHGAGFSVDVETPVGGDLYATGANVTLRSAVASDLSAAGLDLRTTRDSRVSGNARLVGGSVTVEGPVTGALRVAAGDVLLDAAVEGDVWLTGSAVAFGPEARIGGRLHYTAPDPVEISAEVVPPERVSYEEMSSWDYMENMRGDWDGPAHHFRPSPLTWLAGFLLTFAFLLLVGALCLGLMPETVERLRKLTVSDAGITLLAGVTGMSVLFGLVPILVMTVVGIPVVPVVVLAVFLGWLFGYLLGVYALSFQAYRTLGKAPEPGLVVRLAILAVGIAVAALLNFVPVLGWMLNFALVLLGVGGLTRVVLRWMAGEADPPAEADGSPQQR